MDPMDNSLADVDLLSIPSPVVVQDEDEESSVVDAAQIQENLSLIHI